ncbi:hypothetical protein Mhun_0693 [Methanospirillum hungatei JF-1]|jgi:hypothetical protein|uniref:Uncharacterized protein n=1 Tax=Methanospirillum hungatei JF-1 (strain ATCC 27890 / DSM 864 / NBRC 100397 / JF-1) TaxID=323259 RepID=Q2FQG4_METHJ|nr:hypothetical protein [Methanospirillum hungatei]ABD40446.1 hypothetical protein Mhun_0693 [Methanospirillum hungatei JF-1]
MEQIIDIVKIISGILILIMGFGFHWIGQLISVMNRDLAIRLGIWEKDNLQEYEVYENGISIADVSLGWIYGVAGAGLLLGYEWGYSLCLIPGFALLYHGISFWSWTKNQIKTGHPSSSAKNPIRISWTVCNMLTGALAIMVSLTGLYVFR